MIRRAQMTDIEDIVTMGREVFERSAYAGVLGEFDEHDARMALVRFIADAKYSLVLVSESKGVLDGFIVATTCHLPFASKGYVSDVALCSTGGQGLRLLLKVREWARERGMATIFGNGFGDERTDRLYVAIGLKRVGGLFMG